MTFLAAGWLLLFVPLAVVAWIVSRRVTQPAHTTAAWLWHDQRNTTSQPAGRRATPPPWVIAALASAAAAIVALAAPTSASPPRVTVVVDPSSRLTRELPAMWARVEAFAGDVIVPGQPDADSIDAIRPTARSTRDLLSATLARASRPALVLTDAADLPSRNLVVRPPTRPAAVRIARLAARDVDGSTRVFVRLERDAEIDGTLVVRSGDARVEQMIDWPAGSRSTEVTLALPAGDRIEATVGGATMRLARDPRARVRLAIRGDVSDAVRRFAAVYARERPSEGATNVTLASGDGSGPGVIVPSGPTAAASAAVRRGTHPAIDGLPAEAFELPPLAVDPPAGFEAVAWRGDRPTVAVRDVAGIRAVWIALDASRPTPAWVALLDAAVRWAGGGGGDAWASATPDDVPASGWTPIEVVDARVDASPGWYRDGDGRLRAVNAVADAGIVADGSPSNQELTDFVAAQLGRQVRVATPAPAWIAAALAALAATLCRLDGSRGRI